MPRCGRGRQNGYGDLTVGGAAGCRDRTVRPAGDIGWRWVGVRRCWNLGWTGWRRTPLRQRKAKPSAIGVGRRKADEALMPPMPVIMLPCARLVAPGSMVRGRRSRRCASPHHSAGKQTSAR